MFSKSLALLAHLSGRLGKRQQFRWGSSRVRGRFYYRFHKPIGKGHWRAYTEHFDKPRTIEARQRLIYNCKPTYKQKKSSLAWIWKLPRIIDGGNTPHEILDGWEIYKHKQPKKVYFYINVLARLVKVSQHSSSTGLACDKRVSVILDEVLKNSRKVINKPRLSFIFASLGAFKHLEKLGRFIQPRKYKDDQLVLLLKAYSLGRLYNPHLIKETLEEIGTRKSTMKTSELVNLLEHVEIFADKLDTRSIALIDSLAKELLNRSLFICQTLIVARVLTKLQSNISEISKEILSRQMKEGILEGKGYRISDLVGILRLLKEDESVARAIKMHVDQFSYEYSTDDLSEIQGILKTVGLHLKNSVEIDESLISIPTERISKFQTYLNLISARPKIPYNLVGIFDRFSDEIATEIVSNNSIKIPREFIKHLEFFEPAEFIKLYDIVKNRWMKKYPEERHWYFYEEHLKLWIEKKRKSEFSKSEWKVVTSLY
jgi:hypothetical protein